MPPSLQLLVRTRARTTHDYRTRPRTPYGWSCQRPPGLIGDMLDQSVVEVEGAAEGSAEGEARVRPLAWQQQRDAGSHRHREGASRDRTAASLLQTDIATPADRTHCPSCEGASWFFRGDWRSFRLVGCQLGTLSGVHWLCADSDTYAQNVGGAG